MITNVHHVQITIPTGAEEEARCFYCGLLGLSEIRKPDSLQGRGGFWLQVGGQEIHVGTEDDVDHAATKAHIAYQTSDLDRWISTLKASGINVQKGIPIPGYDRIEFRDPFGNRVELIQEQPR